MNDKTKHALKLAHDYLLSKQMGAHIIAAIREALAEQPAQQEQEPFCYHDGRNIVGKEFADHSDVFPLYTSPPASKPWVGLTDEEKAELDAEYGDDTLAHLDAIEAKLREKNA